MTDADPPVTTAEPEGWRWTPGRIVGVALTLAITVFWMWAFSPLPDRGNPDRMSDRAFPAAAETICADAMVDIAALPPATGVTSLDERADLVDEGTVVIRVMVADLRELGVDNTEEAAWVDAWLDDYSTYADDRDNFAAALRSGDDRAPEFTVRGVEGVQTLIFGFAKVNEMDSCVVPGDV